jgi:pilus assembly protein CpaC
MHRIFNGNALPWRSLVFAVIVMGGGGARTPAQQPNTQPSALIVPTNGTLKLQMSKKQKIKTVTNPKENVVSLRTLQGDPTTILVTGQQDGVTHIEMEDAEGNKETYEVIVQADVEYLREQLRRALPAANITVIPISTNPPPGTVLLTGTVTHDADVAVVRGLVMSVGFKFIDSIRVGGVQQVQLDVVIAKVNRSDLRNLTFNFLGSSRYAAGGSTVGGAASVGSSSSGGTTSSGFPLGGAGSSLSSLATTGPGTNLLLGFVHNAWGFQNFLEALRTNNLAKLLAEPRLVTLSGRPASFLVGGQQAIPMTGSFGGAGVTFASFGTTLNFLPIVLGNGKIYLEVSPSVSSLDQANGIAASANLPAVAGRDINYITTSVEMESGQTLVLGGLIQHEVQATVSKVPCLGDLKLFGTLFRSVQYQDTEQEVLVIVTPWLVDSLSCNQRPKMLPGEETRRPDNFELFLEGIIEAPRGPRQIYQDGHYVPAWVNSPSAKVFPCVGKKDGCCGINGCGVNGCGANGCGGPPAAAAATPVAPPAETMPPPTSPPPLETPLQPVPSDEAGVPPAAANEPLATNSQPGELR